MIRLSDHIASCGGWLSLERFMEIALYDPADGYYSSTIRNVGRLGDFSTSATLSPLLGRALAAEWKKACLQAGRRLPVIEIGAGNATLALAFRNAVGFWERLRLKYHIVESSGPLREFQHLALGSAARIYPTMERALKACKAEAFIFSNEVVDAFPARVFEYTENGWMEVGLSLEGGEIVETLRPIENAPDSTALECDSRPGQRVEVHQSWNNWFLSWLPHWKHGIMTTIDYGGLLEDMYERKPAGTLRAYRKHELLIGMDVYAHPGKRDLTCDVNFSDLLRLLGQCPGDRFSLTDQREYLLPYASGSSEDEFLVRERGAGDHFKVLIHQRVS